MNVRVNMSHKCTMRNGQCSGPECGTGLIVRHKTPASAAAELTEDIIGYTMKWSGVLLSNQLW